MNSVGLIAAAIVPTVLILLWLNRRGRPWSPVLLAVALGAVASVPAVCLETAFLLKEWTIGSMGALFLFTLVVAGVIEESCKLLAFYAGPARSRFFVEEYDGILLAGAVSLGFATVENIFYVWHGGFMTAWWRAWLAIPAHAVFGVILGSYLGLARVRREFGWGDNGLVASGLFLAALAHGFYDLLAFQQMSIVAAGLLLLFMGYMVLWSLDRVRAARARSAAYGGFKPILPPPLWFGKLQLPPVPVSRNRWVSGALGFIPGLGQAYNRDRSKALLFFLIGVVNLGLYYTAHFFVQQPKLALDWVQWLGFQVTVTPDEMVAAVQQKWMLVPILMTMVCLWAAIGAVDAYLTAGARWPLQQNQYAVRRSFSTHGLGTSYVFHLLVVFMLVLAPILAGKASAHQGDSLDKKSPTAENSPAAPSEMGGGGGPKNVAGGGGGHPDWNLTWVEPPVKIEGWRKHPHGTVTAKGDQFIGEKPLAEDDKGAGMVEVKPGPTNSQPPKGQPSTYNEYLSYQIRRNRSDWYYFRNVPPDVWSVVRYRIAADGTLLEAQLVKTNGTLDEGNRAVGVVMRSAPYLPLPESAKSIQITELFWTLEGGHFEPGTLEQRLSSLPDGRSIEVEK